MHGPSFRASISGAKKSNSTQLNPRESENKSSAVAEMGDRARAKWAEK